MSRTVRALLLALAGALVGVAAAEATTAVPVPEADLIDHARAVVVGRVTAIHSRWDGARIATDVTLAVDEVLKGRVPPGPLTLTQLGGRVGAVELAVDGSPEFAAGERVLVFLHLNRDGTPRVAHLYQGKFSIEVDGVTGEETAVRGRGRGHVHVLGPGGAADRLSLSRDRRRLDDFRRRIRAGAGAGPGAPVTGELATAPTTGTPDAAGGFTFLGTPPSRWFEPDAGGAVRMLLNNEGEPAAPGLGFDAVRSAYAGWSGPGSGFRYTDGGFTTAAGLTLDGVNTVSFGDRLGQMDPPANCAGTLALGGFWRDESQTRVVNGQTFARIIEGDVVFADGWAGCGVLEDATSVAEIATHELGHVLGLGHSSDSDATMWSQAHLDGRGATIRDDDRAAVAALYPPPRLTVVLGGGGGGSVSSAPAGIACGADCTESYPRGTSITLAATPAAGSSFGGWSGGGCAGIGGCAVTLGADTTITATFVAPLAVSITAPASGATVSGTTTVTMAASGGAGSYVYRLAVDGATVYTGTSASFGWNTAGVAAGSHTLTATVTDGAGRTATASIPVTVAAPAAGLKVFITSPAAGATVSGAVWVAIWTESSAVAPTAFTLAVDGRVVTSESRSGAFASLPWDTRTVGDGARTLTASVRDASGKTGSATLGVTVANGAPAPATPPPLTAALTSPAAGSTVSGLVTVGLTAGGGTPPYTYVLRIDGGATPAIGPTSATTASRTWDTTTATAGAHTLALTVTDSTGATATASRSVTVDNAAPPPPTGGLALALTSPKAGAVVSGTVWATVWLTSTDSVAPYTYTLSVAGRQVWSQSSSSKGPVTMPWDTRASGTADGATTLTAGVADAAGKSGAASVTVTVQNGPAPAPAPLTASFTSPAAGATVSGIVTVGMAAGGGTAPYTYALRIDTAALPAIGPTASATASVSWDTRTSANGSHTLSLTVTDGAGATATASRTVTVSNTTTSPAPAPAPGALAIAVTSPRPGAIVSGTVWTTVWVTSTDGTAPYVYTVSVGGRRVWSQSSSSRGPVTMPWDTRASATPNGPATIEVTVTDATGRAGAATVGVTVAN